MIQERSVKNGDDLITYELDVDPSKPKAWVEGHEYKFNSRIVSITVSRCFFKPKKL